MLPKRAEILVRIELVHISHGHEEYMSGVMGVVITSIFIKWSCGMYVYQVVMRNIYQVVMKY